MNYEEHYKRLCQKAERENRTKGDGRYYEMHHILPRALGGADTEDNMVLLTGKEHFIAHLLLAKIHGKGMIHAAHMMSNIRKYTSKDYEWLKKAHAERVSEYRKGVAPSTKIYTPERNAKIGEALRGRSKSKEQVEKTVAARRRNGTYVRTEEQKRSTSEKLKGEGNPMYGQTHDTEARDKISQANKQKVSCPHCGTEGGVAIMKRWHFDRCRHKQ